MFGGVLLQSPPLYDHDQRDMFCVYLLPGSQKSTEVGIYSIRFDSSFRIYPHFFEFNYRCSKRRSYLSLI